MAVRRILAVAVAGSLMVTLAAPARATHAPPTNVERRMLSELDSFTSWLADNRAKGFIGEVGWPSGDDASHWNHAAELWMDRADRERLWVTAWATGEWWPSDYRLAIYSASTNERLDSVNAQAEVLEPYLAQRGRGINVAGGEFAAPSNASTSAFSNKNPGTYGVDYHYDSAETFAFLASRGVRTVRIPFRWERVQPRLGKRLSKTEVRRMKGAVARAAGAGLEVILDMHNYGAYYLHRDGAGIRRPVGSRRCKVAHLVDVWRRLSRNFAGNSAVFGYGLMNEPTGIRATATVTAAERWERASQRVLDAMRARGDKTMIFVPGYDWSGLQSWRVNHPDAWIDDPANRFRYEAHHYWDHDHSGRYALTYEEELNRAAS